MKPNERLYSLDALRGFDMLFIMGLETLIVAICMLFPAGENSWVLRHLDHAQWNGLHIMDLVFPLFLFIAGISWPLSYAKQLNKGASKGLILKKIFKRTLILILIGVVYNRFFTTVFTVGFAGVRYCSVLSRIALAWMFGALLYMYLSPRKRVIVAVVLLVGYSLLCMIPSPTATGASPLSPEGCLSGWIDRLLVPGKLYFGTYDPEGLLGTIPATVTAMLGIFTGEWISKKGVEAKKALWMAVVALILFGVGLLWSLWTPINKNLWSSSFVLVAGGISLALFAIFYYIIDVRGHTKWAFPLTVIGRNSITIYLIQEIIPFGTIAGFFLGGLATAVGPLWGGVITNCGYILLCWLFLFFLYRKKVFLKV